MNRLASSCAFVLASTVLSGATAWSQPSAKALYTPVARPEPSQPSSVALHALAKEAHLSLLADADDVDQAPPGQQQPDDGASTRPLRALLNQWSQSHTLNWKRLSDGTPSGNILLVWSAPDPLALVAKWRAEAPAAVDVPTTHSASTIVVPVPPPFSFGSKTKINNVPPPLTPFQKAAQELTLALTRAFTSALDQKAAGLREKAVVDLPEEVRQKILALAPVAPATEGAMNQEQAGVLGEEFWKNATLHLQNIDLPDVGPDGKPRAHLMPALFVTGHFPAADGQVATVMLGLTAWPQASTPQPPVAAPPTPTLPVAAPPTPAPATAQLGRLM